MSKKSMPWGRLHLLKYQSLALFTLKSHNNSQYVVVIQLETYAIIVFFVCVVFLFLIFNLNLGPNTGSEFICILINTPNQTIMFLGFKNPLITNF